MTGVADLEAARIGRAQQGDEGAFQQLVGPHVDELRMHCYRMTGSIHDSEDLIQETLLRAWKGLGGFQRPGSFRAWLYRIATNATLSKLGRKSRSEVVLDLGTAAAEMEWLQPFPGPSTSDAAERHSPEAIYTVGESVRLAFVVAMQLLAPRQRAALLLKDVLGMSSREAADVLGSSVASVNSLLQRARSTLRVAGVDLDVRPSDLAVEDRLVDAYVAAWRAADIEAMLALIREDAVLAMPPASLVVRGRRDIGAFLRSRPPEHQLSALEPVVTTANGQPAVVGFARAEERWLPEVLTVLTIGEGGIARMTAFPDPGIAALVPAEPPD